MEPVIALKLNHWKIKFYGEEKFRLEKTRDSSLVFFFISFFV
jgi:hypothetical protein